MTAERHQESSGTELGRFLWARRTQVTPAEAGFAPGTSVRRTPGLRREEVAALAGISIDYYTRLERGKETRPSPSVIDALARALRLDHDEHEHLRALAARAANPGALALYAGLDDWPAGQRNLARFLFLHPAARDVYAGWDQQIRRCVARLRALAGTDPDAPDLAALVGELLLKSPDFARLWERYDVKGRTTAQQTKTFHHPKVGTITLGFQGMQLEDTPGQRLGVYTAEPGTPDHDAMILLDMTAVRRTATPAAHGDAP